PSRFPQWMVITSKCCRARPIRTRTPKTRRPTLSAFLMVKPTAIPERAPRASGPPKTGQLISSGNGAHLRGLVRRAAEKCRRLGRRLRLAEEEGFEPSAGV